MPTDRAYAFRPVTDADLPMLERWLNVPHVTHHEQADITDTEAFRKALAKEAEQRGVRVTMLSFLLKACAVLLQQYPSFNASLASQCSPVATLSMSRDGRF